MQEIEGFEGKYGITKNGQVWAYPRNFGPDKRGRPRYKKGGFLKHSIANTGYPVVNLTLENSKQRVFTVHRLVAKTFIPNPESLPQVNHLNYDRTDCRVSNLEWCTCKENARHRMKRIQ